MTSDIPETKCGWPPAAGRFLRLALLALVATTPLATEWVYQRTSLSQLYYVKLAGLAVVMLVVITIVILRLPLKPPTRLFWCYLAYLGVILVSVIARPARGYGLSAAMLPLTGAGLLFALETVPFDRRRQESALLLFVLLGFVSAACGILQNFGIELVHRAEPVTERQVLVSFFGHSNFMASFVGPIIFLAAYFIDSRRDSRLVGFAASTVLMILLCLYWAGTRAASVACIFAALSLVRWRRPRIEFNRRRALLVTAIALISLAAVTIYGQKWGRHRETLLRRLSSHRELRNRLFFWLIGTEMIRERPLLGIGYGRYNTVFWPYTERFLLLPGHNIFSYILREMNGTNPGQAHNDLLEADCETGVAGAAAFIGIWVLAFLFCHRCARRGEQQDRRLARYLRAALVFVFVDSLFGFPLQLPASALLFWFLLAFVAQTYRRLDRTPGGAGRNSTVEAQV